MAVVTHTVLLTGSAHAQAAVCMSEAHVVQGGHGWPGADPSEVRAHAAQWLDRSAWTARAAVPFGRQGSLGGSARLGSAAQRSGWQAAEDNYTIVPSSGSEFIVKNEATESRNSACERKPRTNAATPRK